MIEIKAPHTVPQGSHTVFLAGSIEMGTAERWQERVGRLLQDTNLTLLNPRRDDWNSEWEQSIDTHQFVEQVEWELEHILNAKKVLFYFDPHARSPITLMELGLVSSRRYTATEVLVVCPEGFWRKGNVDVLCRRQNIQQYDTLEAACVELRAYSRWPVW